MARLNDTRGVVYVEFVFAFMPLFLMFLFVCQLALLSLARLVVQHAALCGARAAIVVLEDAPEHYADVPRGNLSDGEPELGLETVLSQLGLAPESIKPPAQAKSWLDGITDAVASLSDGLSHRQRGARMVSIRAAATMPLLLLAPNAGSAQASVAQSLPGDFVSRLPEALEYTAAAGVVTVHALSGGDELIAEPVPRNAPITVRVTYLMPCGMPLVRDLMCHDLVSLLSPDSRFFARLRHAQGADALRALLPPSGRFVVLEGQSTLPNQGAGYEHPEES
jgi:hypothetical protein